MKTGERKQVLKVELDAEVCERLRYLGVTAGAEITLLKVSFLKRTYLVQARSAKIAIGREVAEGILICNS